MTILIDSRGGSKNLPPYIRRLGPQTESAHGLDGDFEFMGWGPGDAPISIGGEYKTADTGDIFTSLHDGRLTGTQIPRMLESYQRVYLIIEAQLDLDRDGRLLYWNERADNGKGRWFTVYGRDGRGWTAQEFWFRIMSIEEFTPVRVWFTADIHDSAHTIALLYRYWQKLYSDHKSISQWDQSHTGRNPGNILIPTSDLPLVTRAAREIVGIGQHKAHFVGDHFKSLRRMANAGPEEWGEVVCREKIKNGPRKGSMQEKRFGKDTIAKIIGEITGE